MGLPNHQSAAVKKGKGPSTTIAVQSIPVPREPGAGQILVKINWSGLCGSDKSLLFDEISFGLGMNEKSKGIAGHEGAGEVVAVAPDVEHLWKIGDRAGIKWVASVCRNCELCICSSTHPQNVEFVFLHGGLILLLISLPSSSGTNGIDEVYCPSQLNSAYSTPGTFQEYVLTDGYYATRIPDNVSDEEAGPIMCGGVTAYVGCKRSAVKPGQWLAVLGAGGGLGHLAVQYARAMGMRVIAIDAGKDKKELSKKLGAEAFIDFSTDNINIPEEVMKLTGTGVHGVLITVGSQAGYDMAPALCRPGATIVAVGIPPEMGARVGPHPFMMIMKRLSIVGTLTGTLRDVDEALAFTGRGLVKVRAFIPSFAREGSKAIDMTYC